MEAQGERPGENVFSYETAARTVQYLPHKQEETINLVIEQADLLVEGGGRMNTKERAAEFPDSDDTPCYGLRG